MRRAYKTALVVAAVALMPRFAAAQDEQSRAVAGGGITAKGWAGKIDDKEAASGAKLENAKLEALKGDTLHVVTGPAVGYWNPANTASGNYTVSATFNEPQFMGLNDHSHPYGIIIGGNKMGTDEMSYLYCAAYGDGRFIVRGFGPKVFMMNGRGAPDAAINKAAGKGSPVMQKIAMTVSADSVSCAINDKTVATYPRSDIVGEGKLMSTDGVYGIRFAHNTEGFVTGLKMTKGK